MANGNGGPPAPGQAPMVPPDPHEVTDALLRACQVAAEQASTAQDTREISEAAKAALAFAQAIVVLDPGLTATGEPLQHALDMEGARQQGALAIEHLRGEHALEQAKLAASAPTPSKSITRDNAGRISGIKG